MASKEGMMFNFFQKWKENRLNTFAKKALKNNPQLEKDLRKLDDISKKILKDLEKID